MENPKQHTKAYEYPDDLADVVAAPPIVFLVGPFTAGIILHFVYSFHLVPFFVAHATGWALIVLGAALLSWSSITMARVGTSPGAYRPPSTLVVTGPFRFSRNPMYVSFVFIYAGVGLLFNALWVVFFLPIVIFGLQNGIIVRDERYLGRFFGDDYRSYLAKVRRWL